MIKCVKCDQEYKEFYGFGFCKLCYVEYLNIFHNQLKEQTAKIEADIAKLNGILKETLEMTLRIEKEKTRCSVGDITGMVGVVKDEIGD